MFHAPHQYSRHAFPGKMDIDLQKTHKKTSSEFGAKFPVETASFDKFFRDFTGPGICCCYCRMALQGRKNTYFFGEFPRCLGEAPGPSPPEIPS